MPSRAAKLVTVMSGAVDTTAPTLTISALSAVGNVVAMQIVASKAVTGFAVGDLTISAGGSLASFATADNITFTVSWTLAAGENTMDIGAGVCQDAAGNNNLAATQFSAGYVTTTPDGTAGVDTEITAAVAGANYGVSTTLYTGRYGEGAGNAHRMLIKFDLSAYAGKTILSTKLSLVCLDDGGASNERTLRAFRLKRAWVEGTRAGVADSPATGATWTRYDTTNNWQTAGGFGANDCEQTDIGSVVCPVPTGGTTKVINLTPSAVQEMANGIFTNNGWLLKMDTENGDARNWGASDNAVANFRPKLEVVYCPFDYAPDGADFSIVHIPDTQSYVDTDEHAETFQAMTQWIANNRVSLDIGLVLHTGDVVIPANSTTWARANLALNTIENIAALPILYCIGNHDYDGPASAEVPADRPTTVWNTYLAQAHFTGKSWWSGGFYEEGKSENAYLLVTIEGVDYIIVALEFGPRQGALDWANGLLTTYAARDAIIITHSYMYQDGTRMGTGDDYNPHTIVVGNVDVHDGEEMWTELVKLHSNIVMTLNGHSMGGWHLQSVGDGGNLVTQILNGHDLTADYGQMGIARFYLASNRVIYTRFSSVTGRIDWQVSLPYKAT